MVHKILKYVHTYINGKMILVETISSGVKENDGGVHSSMIYFRNLCKCHNVHPAQQ
jgi:hypothetical protein